MNKVIVSHPTGNANVRALVESLVLEDLLYEFYTSIAVFAGSPLDKLAQFQMLSELQRRAFEPSLQAFTRLWPFREIGRTFSNRFRLNSLVAHERGPFCIDRVFKSVDSHTSSRLKKAVKHGVRGIYAYEDGAINSFKQAKKLGLRCLYDLPTAYWKTVRNTMDTEVGLNPEWADTIAGLNDSNEKLSVKDQELILADQIFVASSFAAKSLLEFQPGLGPVNIIPYGFPPVTDSREYRAAADNSPLKLLFVGRLTQMKGISYLFEAVKRVGKSVELTVVGHKPTGNCQPLNNALIRHRWIPSLPHRQIIEAMKRHDLLILPSLLEGFGLVISEAMSQGTPVIATDRTVGVDLITHGKNGWLIEAGSADSILEILESLLERPEAIAETGIAARTVAKNRPWKIYGTELTERIRQSIN